MASVVEMVPHMPSTAVEEIHARGGHDALVEVRAAAVMAKIVEAYVERGDPEELGPCEFRLGHPDAGSARRPRSAAARRRAAGPRRG